jgi:hypothetical protein
MTVLCCGDREWAYVGVIRRVLTSLGPGTIVVHGGMRGADAMCARVARSLGYQVVEHKADWQTHGKRAGPIRNQTMLDRHPEIARVIAFHDRLTESKGTADMVQRARRASIPVTVVTSGHLYGAHTQDLR